MASGLPSLSTDQIAAFVELSRQGQIRAAAGVLGITEQGLRNRLLTLEAAPRRRAVPKEPRSAAIGRAHRSGPAFSAPCPRAFSSGPRSCAAPCEVETGAQEIRVASSQYLTRYLLIDVLKDFRRAAPEIHVRISTMNELEVEESPARTTPKWRWVWPRPTNHRPISTTTSCSR